MKLSMKSDYGVRALIELALSGGEGPVQRAEIAARQHIPESYLDHLLAQLRRDGFVRSIRGPGGGHLLTREPSDMCLLHVIESLEGSVAPIACVEEGGECPHEPGECAQRWVWEDIYQETRRRLGAVSLADLAERASAQRRATAANYSI
jgi:Rrf2 family protein